MTLMSRGRAFVPVGLGVWLLTVPACDSSPGVAPDSLALRIASVVPDSGPTGSAVDVRISGGGFRPGAVVAFGGTALGTIVVDSATIVTTAPPHAEGRVDVVVTNPGGHSVTLAGGYSYVPVAVRSVTPNAGFPGARLTIGGTGFLPGAVVTLDGIPAGHVGFLSGSSVQATAPAHGSGAVDVVVTNPGGQQGSLSSGFIYQALTLAATPDRVVAGGQLRVSWTTTAGTSALDWIGLFPAGASNFDYLDYAYTSGAASGTQTWRAPASAGAYEFRYLPNDDSIDVARVPFVVEGSATSSSAGLPSVSRRQGRGGARAPRR